MTGQERNNALFIADAIRQIFGINSPIYFPYGKKVPYEAGEYSNIQILPDDEGCTAPSEFDTHAFGVVSFEAGEYNVYNRITGAVEKVTMGLYTLPYSCIVEFGRDANMTETEVLGATGTVKEIYGKSGWKINIRGIAMNSRDGKGATAQQQINELVKWDEVCDSIPVLGSIFQRKKINNIAVKSLSIQPIVGRWSAIPFQIEAVSDEPIEFYNL